MSQDTKASSRLSRPVEAVTAALHTLPGAGIATRLAGNALDAIGTVSPRARRVAVYSGAGLLGVVGVVEWPVVATVAAAAWLTQPRPGEQQAAQRNLANGHTAVKESRRSTANAKSATSAKATKSRAGASSTRRRAEKSKSIG